MKSFMKSLIIGLICIAVVLNAPSKAVCIEEREDGRFDYAINMPDSHLEQKDALKAYSTLRQYFNLDNKGCVISYPECYGGTYINDNHELVLRVTNYDTWVNDAVENIRSKNESITIELCSVSLNEVVLEYLTIKDSLPCDKINCSYYSAAMNSYVLRCYKENEDTIYDALSRINASDRITIQIDETKRYDNTMSCVTPNLRTSYLYGGILLYCGQQLRGTLGVCGSYGNYNHCYLTAGHVAYNCSVGPTTNTSDQYSPVLCEFENGGYGDYAVVPAPTSYQKSNQIYTSNSLARTSVTKYYGSYDFPDCARVYKYGQATGMTYGAISGMSYSGYTDKNSNYELNGMIVVSYLSNNYISAPGDSGGPCWTYFEDDEDEEVILLGTVSGGAFPYLGAPYQVLMYVSPICYATSDGFAPYNMTAVTSLG